MPGNTEPQGFCCLFVFVLLFVLFLLFIFLCIKKISSFNSSDVNKFIDVKRLNQCDLGKERIKALGLVLLIQTLKAFAEKNDLAKENSKRQNAGS